MANEQSYQTHLFPFEDAKERLRENGLFAQTEALVLETAIQLWERTNALQQEEGATAVPADIQAVQEGVVDKALDEEEAKEAPNRCTRPCCLNK